MLRTYRVVQPSFYLQAFVVILYEMKDDKQFLEHVGPSTVASIDLYIIPHCSMRLTRKMSGPTSLLLLKKKT